MLLTITLLGCAAFFAYQERINIQNWLLAQDYTPTTKISDTAAKLHLTESGKLLFYSTHPEITNGTNFRNGCSAIAHSESAHVVGCYTHAHKVYVFDVTDSRLQGIVEVTAAHELLHGAWAQMSRTEQEALANQLNTLYAQLQLTDEALKERMEVYSELDKLHFANELHSVLATEVKELPAWLEEHYSKWFNNRQNIVNMFFNYRSIFATLQAEAQEIENQMQSLRETIENERLGFELDVERYNIAVSNFNSRNDNYEFSQSPDEFYQLVERYREERQELTARRAQIQNKIDEYETLRERLMAISETSKELNNLLDSSLSDF